MNCIYCQGQMKRGGAPFHIDRKGYQNMTFGAGYGGSTTNSIGREQTSWCLSLISQPYSLTPNR